MGLGLGLGLGLQGLGLGFKACMPLKMGSFAGVACSGASSLSVPESLSEIFPACDST